jgi:hypothetical protein
MVGCGEADLTRIGSREDTSDVVGATSEEVASVSLPEDWLPENSSFTLVARRDPKSGLWEAILPSFSIAGQGESLDDAIENAVDLLRDYLALSARDGLSYWDARRPLPVRARLPIYAGIALYVAAAKLRERRADRSYLRLPLHRERTAH